MRTCVFINLAAASDRRRRVESAFAAAQPQGWSLARFEALGPADVAHIPGALTPAEKGCFASHRAAIGARLDDAEPLFVVEDDAVFGPRTFPVLDGMLGLGGGWDVLFTDLALFDLDLMLRLARRRGPMLGRGEYSILDLKGRPFAGAAAYAVAGPAKVRLHAALSRSQALDQPYDLYLRDLCQTGELRMGAVFPFLTRPAPEAEASQIQSGEHALFDATMNAWRQLMSADRDLEECATAIEALSVGHADPEARLVGALFGVIASDAFPLNR